MAFGSSSNWPATSRAPGIGAGVFDSIDKLGAEFASSGLVLMKYCDGASFSGHGQVELHAKHGSVRVGRHASPQGSKTTVHFAGRGILNAALDLLLSPAFGLAHATDVLLSGCSAGGLAALLAAEAVRRRLLERGAPLSRFKVLSFSGVFQGGDGSPYFEQMRSVYTLANVSASIPAACRFLSREPWRCIIGTQPLDSLPADLPVFIEQSALDRWQTGCVLGAQPSKFEIVQCSAGDWDRCLHFMSPLRRPAPAHRLTRRGMRATLRRLATTHPPPRLQRQECTPGQLGALDGFSFGFLRDLLSSAALHPERKGNGAFLHGCHSHCPNRLNRFLIGQVSLEMAILLWWRASPDAPASRHTHVGCLTNWSSSADAAVARCHPSCSPLYPWPDERKKVRLRSADVDLALHGRISPELLGAREVFDV